MKRFYKDATVRDADEGFQVMLDGRPIRTQGGSAQIVPSLPLAEAMAEEWNRQGDKIDLSGFALRDLADFAIDGVRDKRSATIEKLLSYAETDTLCYRADPDEPLFQRQRQVWKPIVTECERTYNIRLQQASGIIHRRQPIASIEALRAHLDALDEFTLAALSTLAPLAASLIVALAAIRDDADIDGLFAASNLEEDWQAEQWGWDHEAEATRAARFQVFAFAARFHRLAQAT